MLKRAYLSRKPGIQLSDKKSIKSGQITNKLLIESKELMNSSQQIVKSIEPAVQSQLELSQKFKIIDKQFESYQRFLEYVDMYESTE